MTPPPAPSLLRRVGALVCIDVPCQWDRWMAGLGNVPYRCAGRGSAIPGGRAGGRLVGPLAGDEEWFGEVSWS
jgi:hypothetical protein